jgi:hypothetical protein
MPYIELADMQAALPPEITENLLDDHGVGLGDAAAWAKIVAAVSREIDGKLGMRFAVPLSPVPAVVHDAAFVLAAEALYHRRGYYGEANPWTARAQGIRGTQGQQGGQPGLLDRIATGEIPLTAAAEPARPAGGVISEPAKTHSSARRLLA